TALQMLAAVGAVANGGTLMQPRLVKAEFDADGREVRRVEPRAVRQVVSLETARTLSRMLVRVVEHGTGHLAAVPGYDVAGKTGTAQKLDPATRRYSRAPGVLSFVGFVPADEPRPVLLGLRVELAGRGRVAQQTPVPGERVHEDAVARLTLLPGGPRAGDAR